MFLGCSFEPRPSSRALATAGSVMAIGLSINGCSSSKKPVLQEKAKGGCTRTLPKFVHFPPPEYF